MKKFKEFYCNKCNKIHKHAIMVKKLDGLQVCWKSFLNEKSDKR